MFFEPGTGLEKVDLVLLDLNMPGMGGYRCLQELLKLDPSARVLIVSGKFRYSLLCFCIAEKRLIKQMKTFLVTP